MSVDLTTVRILKRQLEQAIFEAVHSFEHETGLSVEDVMLDKVDICDSPRRLTSHISTRVEV